MKITTNKLAKPVSGFTLTYSFVEENPGIYEPDGLPRTRLVSFEGLVLHINPDCNPSRADSGWRREKFRKCEGETITLTFED